MNTTSPPDEADLAQRIWSELQRATVDRHHEWRSPVLATTGLDGLPQARTVVLRAADAAASRLVFFTDSRSPKVRELQVAPAAAFVFWSKRLSWQLRAQVVSQVCTDGPVVDAAWERVSQSAAAGDYLAAQAPGSAWRPSAAGGPGTHHLAVVTSRIEQLDWLELARDGHRRARLSGASMEWLVP